MAKHLSEDQIKWILSLDASQADQAVRKFNQDIIAATTRNKELRSELVKLEAAGKKDSQQYRLLSKEMSENSSKITTSRESLKKLENQMGLNNLSMVQLKSHAKDLQKQLDQTSQALHPQEYQALGNQLKSVRNRMDELKTSGSMASKQMSGSFASQSQRFALLNNVYNQIAIFFSGMVSKMKDFISTSVSVAVQANGIKKAFDRLDDPTILDNLRKAVRGTLSDTQLKKLAVEADNFGIPIQNLSKYLEFAHLRASQTGKSMSELSETIVNGIGKQSTKRLAVLGLNVKEINEEVKKTGHFFSGVSDVIENELKRAGGDYSTVADAALQRAAELENEQEKLGEEMLPLIGKWKQLLQVVWIFFAKAVIYMAKHKSDILDIIKAITLFTLAVKVITTVQKTYLAVQTSTALATAIMEENTVKTEKAMTAYTAATEKNGIVTKAMTAISLLCSAAYYLVTGNLVKAKAAMVAFTEVTKLSLWGWLAISVAAVATGLYLLYHRAGEASQAMKSFSKINSEIGDKMKDERAKIEMLSKIVHDGNASYDERYKALTQLQSIVPSYHASLTKEGKLMRDNTSALNNYLKLKEKEIIYDASKDELTNLYKQKLQAQVAMNEAQSNLKKTKDLAAQMNKSHQVGGSTFAPMNFSASNTAAELKVDDTLSKLKQIDTAISLVRQAMRSAYVSLPQATSDNHYNDAATAVNKKKKTTKIDYNAATLNNMEAEHDSELAALKAEDKKKEKLEEDTNIDIEKSDIEYYNRRIAKLQEFMVKAKNAQKKAGYNKEISELQLKESDQQDQIDENQLKKAQNYRQKQLDALTRQADAQKTIQETNLENGKITQAQYDDAILAIDAADAANRLTIEKNLLEEVNDLEIKNGDKKAKAVTDAGDKVAAAERAAAEKRKALFGITSSFQKKFSSEGDSKDNNIKTDYETQKVVMHSTYQAGKDQLTSNGMDTKNLDSAYNKAKEDLERNHQVKISQIRQEYGFNTYKDQLKQQLADVDTAEKQGVMTKKEAEAQKIAISAESYKKQADYYENLFSGAVQAMQQSEEDNVDAQYDGEIQAAQGNSEQVEALENEKAKKKLAIQKKYADVNFAIKVSQIISDTAVSIMKAYADLGPIAGAVSAALMGVTGAMQIKSAKAERDKVKRMTISSSSSTSTTSSTRLATGLESGGYVDVTRKQDGKDFHALYDPDKRGFVDSPTVIVGEGANSREWVASNAAVTNPTVAPVLSLLDAAQQAGTIRSLDLGRAIKSGVTGYASGGSINQQPIVSPASSQADSAILKLNELLTDIKTNGVKSIVGLTDLDAAQELRNRSRAIGSK